jgi:hypothetical protein
MKEFFIIYLSMNGKLLILRADNGAKPKKSWREFNEKPKKLKRPTIGGSMATISRAEAARSRKDEQ